MSVNKESQTNGSYVGIIRDSAPSNIACAICDAQKLPICICRKGAAEEESEDDTLDDAQNDSDTAQSNQLPAPTNNFVEVLEQDQFDTSDEVIFNSPSPSP